MLVFSLVLEGVSLAGGTRKHRDLERVGRGVEWRKRRRWNGGGCVSDMCVGVTVSKYWVRVLCVFRGIHLYVSELRGGFEYRCVYAGVVC